MLNNNTSKIALIRIYTDSKLDHQYHQTNNSYYKFHRYVRNVYFI